MAVYPVLRLVSVNQLDETFKSPVCKVSCITVSCSGCVRQHNIDASRFSYLSFQFFYTTVHLSLTVLIWSAAINRTASKSENSKVFINKELIFNAVAPLGRKVFIRAIVISVNIQKRYPRHCHEKRQILCIKVTGRKNEIIIRKHTGLIILPQIGTFLIAKQQQFHSRTLSFCSGTLSR